ncbi:Putative amidoligase enzyme [uncultured Caudovirales phage]|uniref:Amidoligase enzyme n=1 Tax=uncultured Caudovirales phage TaxID=2100421 RepID=A0A6J7WGV0_9CAUD|nr:Putative amidoligase enzyme [uncultured Caudovirales phage]
MRFKHFKPSNLTEQQLDELRINPTTLQQFAKSGDAQGIVAGFEAELVFTGLGGEGDYDQDPEPDYDADERCYTIEGVMEFFENDEYGYGISGRDASRLQDDLDDKYTEWYDEQMHNDFRNEAEDRIREVWEEEFDREYFVEEYLKNELDLTSEEIKVAMEAGENAPRFNSSSEQKAYIENNPAYEKYLEADEIADAELDELVEKSVDNQDEYWDQALDEFRENYTIDNDSSFFSDIGLRYMSDVANEFSLMWPVITYTGGSAGGFNQDSAERLARDLEKELGVKTNVSGGYHSAKRDNETWIFEPDSSLDANDDDDMPVEIVSPPMPLEECLRQMENFFAWAESNGAYANKSTGFHMGVSLPYTGGRVDYIKLALFLGDEHVLREFGRSGNHFCEAAIKKIRQSVKGKKQAVGNALELMKHNLIELAQKALEINNHGFGKYTSINPQGGNDSTRPDKERGAKYIEFRSAGGSNYFENIDKLKNTLLRYAQAMHIASRPDLERKEYYKKLYKLIAPPEGDPALDLFSRFATGEISSTELKKTWADKILNKDAPELTKKGIWQLYNRVDGTPIAGERYSNYTKQDAWTKAKQSISPGSSAEGFEKAYELRDMNANTGRWNIVDRETKEVLDTVEYPEREQAVDRAYSLFPDRAIYVEPAANDKPSPELSRRAKLAKNIKDAPAEPVKRWIVYDTETGEEHYNHEGRKSNLVQAMRKMEQDNKWPRGRLSIKLADIQPDDELNDLHKELGIGSSNMPKWEIYSIRNGHVFHTISSDSQQDAEAQAQQWFNDNDVENTSAFGLRQKSSETQQQQNTGRAPEGFLTQRPATGNYVLRRRENGEGVGPVLYQFQADSNSDAIEQARRWTNSKGVERLSVWLDHTANVPREAFTNNLSWRDQLRRHIEPTPGNRTNEPTRWEIRVIGTGEVIHNFSLIPGVDRQAVANREAQEWADRQGLSDPVEAVWAPEGPNEVPIDVAQNFQEPPASWDSGPPSPQASNQQRSDWEFYRYDDPDNTFWTMQNATAEEAMQFIQDQETGGMPPGFIRTRQIQAESVLSKWESIVESMISPVCRLGR